MKKRIRTKLLVILSTLTVGLASLGVVTLAKYNVYDKVGQPATRDTKPPLLLYLNANIWTRGTDSSGVIIDPNYYLWVITGASTGYLVSPSKYITHEVYNNAETSYTMMNLYVFEYKQEWVTNSRDFLFIRANPTQAISSFTSWPSESVVWNKTDDISYTNYVGNPNPSRNYFSIDSWHGGTNKYKDEYNSGYGANALTKLSNGRLKWGY